MNDVRDDGMHFAIYENRVGCLFCKVLRKNNQKT